MEHPRDPARLIGRLADVQHDLDATHDQLAGGVSGNARTALELQAASLEGVRGDLAALLAEVTRSRLADPMPVFVIKAKDELAIAAVSAYRRLCESKDLRWQADQVREAAAEMSAWRERNPESVKLPDHPHVPVRRAVCGATNHHPCAAQPSMFGGQHACAENPHDGEGHQCSCGTTFTVPIHRVGDIETLLLAAVQHGGAIPGVPPIPSPARCACGRSATSLWSDGSVRCDDCPAE